MSINNITKGSIPCLPEDSAPDSFPHPRNAINGLIAVGGDLSPERLLIAYPKGIFPWYEETEPILWWSPDPRTILLPKNLHVSRRLARSIRQSSLKFTADIAFPKVVQECAAPRRKSPSTWISKDMSEAYTRLHDLGWAHSFEAWHDGDLVAGIYGIAIGRVFFGESMFTRLTDASKILLVNASKYLISKNYELIDCQVWSKHLASLGAITVSRAKFLKQLDQLCKPVGSNFIWTTEHARYTNLKSN